MHIEQFFDKGLAHASYAIISNQEIALIDPARDPQPYYDLAKQHTAKIVAVIETHPHADFVSSHVEIAKATGATIYVSKLLGAEYTYKPFDQGDKLRIGNITLEALNTPGHSPDSISILLKDENGKNHALFTGDTLFIGDVGRPDLRENIGNITAKREQLAKQMYQSTRNIIMPLEKDVLVYPAHGAGSLCGKNMSPDLVSTIGRELEQNYALKPMSEADFVQTLLQDQPFIPKYFGFDVMLNKKGATNFAESVENIPILKSENDFEEGILVIDTRPEHIFKKVHVKGALNIQDGGKFETWLGSVVAPEEKFYLIATDENTLKNILHKVAKIGYEKNIVATLIGLHTSKQQTELLDFPYFKQNLQVFHILDIRNVGEFKEKQIFANAQHIPLPELRERIAEIPADKPIVVHCAAGYRSAIAASILEKEMPQAKIYDLGEAIKDF